VVPVAVLELSHGVMKAMFVSKLKGAVAGLMVVTVVAWTGAAGSWQTASAVPQEPSPGKSGGGKQTTRDRDAERIAQLERERDELRKKLAEALDRLVALETQVQKERYARSLTEANRASPDQPAFVPNPPRTTNATTPGYSDPLTARPSGGTRAGSPTSNPLQSTFGSPAPDGRLPGTPPPAPATPLVLKAYRLADLAADEKQAEAVVRVIQSLVERESWKGAGGAGVIENLAAKKLLLVRQTAEVHLQVDALVRLLMESGDAPARPGRSSNPGVRP
jgi:hypothetical protein